MKIGKHLIFSMVLSLFAAVLFTSIFNYSGWLRHLSLVAMTTAFTFSIYTLFQRYDASLIQRMEASNPFVWDVMVNKIKVGSVTDAQAAAMERYAFNDNRNWLAQLFNLCTILRRTIGYLIVHLPITLFWILIALIIFSPESYTAIITGLQKDGVPAISSGAMAILPIMLIFSVLVLPICWAFGSRFGFENAFSASVSWMLREHCKTAADGYVALSRKVNMESHLDNLDLGVVSRNPRNF